MSESFDPLLVELAQRGYSAAMTALVKQVVPFVKARAKSMRVPGLETDDLVQEGLIAFLSAVCSFRPDCGASLRTYAYACINNRLASCLRTQLAKKHSVLNDTCPLDENTSVPGESDPERVAEADEIAEKLIEVYYTGLTDFEREAFRCSFSGMTAAQTAAHLGSGVKAAANAIQRARRKLKNS